jgi:general secretion pathway protein M
MMGSEWLVGRRGQALALAATALVCFMLWLGLVQPLLSWYADRATTLLEQRALADRMESLAASLPALRRQAEAGAGGRTAANLGLSDTSDSVASATLQEQVQAMATAAGAMLASVETLPAESAGAWRRIGLRVTLTTPWPVLVGVLRALDEATPRLLVDDLHVHGSVLAAQPVAPPLQTSFTVYAFRAGTRTEAARP